jgi:acetyl-CoA carboxylase biotin carboxyl carrier protein
MAKSKTSAAKKTAKKSTAKASARKSAGKKSAAKKKPAATPSRPAAGLMGDVERLMGMMASNDVTELDLEDGKCKISLKRGVFTASPAPAPAAAPLPAPAAGPAPAAAPAAEEAPAATDNLLEITSPMVGTFYAAPSPDSDAYVKTGDTVHGETVVCIVEAMKVMNEIKAECSGTIAEICVENAQPVEFGQVLFRVKPA